MNFKSILFYTAGAVVLAFLVSLAISPVHKMREFQNWLDANPGFTAGFDSLSNHPGMRELAKEKAYKQALLRLSESDSIQMVVNLTDSAVLLQLKGVTIHRTKIREYNTDKLLKKIPLIQEVQLFSEPLPVHWHRASIVKEPVVVRHAPRDTLEAALNAWRPDTLLQNPAFAAFRLEHGIQLVFEQDKNESLRDNWKRFHFHYQIQVQNALTAISNFISLKKQDYYPTVTIKIPVDDLRAIYRALPGKAFIVLKI